MGVVLSKNRVERRFGWILLFLWVLVLAFYGTWDGWIWEWSVHGYDGASQHFDLDLFDLRWTPADDGSATYASTNNLHNIIYICFAVFTMAWIGLLFGSGWARQGVMATMGYPFVATLVTLDPGDHLYAVQIVYDIVHIVGIAAGAYFFSKDSPAIRRSMTGLAITWCFYLISRISCEPWPFWSEPRNAYVSVNSINDMPFYFYGLEFALAVLLNLGLHAAIIALLRRTAGSRARALLPLVVYGAMCGLLKSLGFIEPPDLGGSTFGP